VTPGPGKARRQALDAPDTALLDPQSAKLGSRDDNAALPPVCHQVKRVTVTVTFRIHMGKCAWPRQSQHSHFVPNRPVDAKHLAQVGRPSVLLLLAMSWRKFRVQVEPVEVG